MYNKLITFFGTLIVITLFWGVFTIYALRFTLPYNPARLPYDNKGNSVLFKAFFPEGFGFFTRNPREGQVTIYRIDKSELTCVTVPNGSVENLFGLSKLARSQNLETGSILSKIDNKEWLECKKTLLECTNYNETPILHLENGYGNPLLCGEYIFTIREPVPWAWSKTMPADSMPTFFIRASIKCVY